MSLGLSLNDVTDTLSSAWGGTYVNDFIDRGRVKKVYIQGDSELLIIPPHHVADGRAGFP